MRRPLIVVSTVLVLSCVVIAAEPASRPRPPSDPDRALDSMLSPSTQGTPVPPPPGSPRRPASRAGEALTLMREGSFVVDRVGRMRRTSDGTQVEFVFDADGSTLRDPPVILMPNLKLMQMETELQSANRPLRFRITGVVTEYKNRNYVLLEKVIVLPEGK